MSNKDRKQSAQNTFKLVYGTNKGNNMIDRTKLEAHILELLSQYDKNPYYIVKHDPSILEDAVNAVIADLPQLIAASLAVHITPLKD